MNRSATVIILTVLIAVLALGAALTGVLWQGQGSHYDFTSLRGETVSIQGHGLYRYDSVSGASQEIAQDYVTLCVGIPLLLVSLYLYNRGSLRGALLLAGTLGYALYTYTSMAFQTAFNELFLVYVALMSLSLWAFVLAVMSIRVAELPAHISPRLPRRGIAALLLFVGVSLTFMWLGRIVPAYTTGAAPFGLEAYATLVIQTMDLGLVVPLAVVAGILLLQKKPFGYLLSAIALLKGFTMAIALIAMIIGQVLAGVAVAAPEVAIFSVLALGMMSMTVVMLRNVQENS